MGQERIPAMRRVLIGGLGGSGKSTLSRQVASLLDLPRHSLDDLYYGSADLSVSPRFAEDIERITADDRWLFDSQGPPVTSPVPASIRETMWIRADTLIWLDYPRPIVLSRAIRRHVRRVVTREQLWFGYRETPWATLDPEHPVRRAWSLHAQRRAEMLDRMADPRWQPLTVLQMEHPRRTRLWVDALAARTGTDAGANRPPPTTLT